MYNTAPEFRALMAEPSRTLSARGLITYPDLAQQSLTAAMISHIQIDEDAGDHLPLGTAGASTLTLKLDNRNGEWEQGGSIRGAHKIEGAKVELELGVWDGTAYLWENLGTYLLEEARGQEQETLIAFKGMDYLGNKALGAFIDDLAYPMTLAAMADLACFQSGFTRKTGAFLNSAVTITERPDWPGDISCRDALAYIAEAAGGFARIDRNGQLEIVGLTISHSWLDDLYASFFDVDGGDLIFTTPEGYGGPEFALDGDDLTVDQPDVVKIVDGEVVVIVSSDGESYYVTPGRYKRLTRQAETLELNAIIFEGREATETSEAVEAVRVATNVELADTALNSHRTINPLLVPGKYEALKTPLTTELLGLSYAGASLDWQGDPTIRTGDCLKIIDLTGKNQAVIITKNKLTFGPGFDMTSSNALKNDAQAGTHSSKPRIFTPDGKINAEAISGVIKRLQIAIGAIGEAQIDKASITVAHMKTATVEALTATFIEAFAARVEYLIANELYTDELYAALASLSTAVIGTAEIDWASIKDLISGRQIFTAGVGDKLYIADLAVTEANMLSLTVGELIVRGNDGLFYALTVDEEGKITTEQKFIVNNDITDETINAATKLIEGSITADRMNANDIFATNAIIKQLIAANIDTDVFFAREAVINKITLDYVTPLNDAITIVSGDLEETNAAIDNLDALAIERLGVINSTLDQLNSALSVVESDLSNNASASEYAIGQINAAIEALEDEALALQGGLSGLQADKIVTDRYIRMGLLYVDDKGTPRHGVAIGEKLTTVTDGEGRVVLERRALATTITSDRISFWRNGRETLYISEDKVVIIRLAMGPWEINTDYGWTLLYKGVS